MEMQWAHRQDAPPPSPRKAQNAMSQLTGNGLEDKVRMGNFAELKSFLHDIPIRINVELFIVRKVIVEMTDLFAGAASHVTMSPCDHVTM